MRTFILIFCFALLSQVMWGQNQLINIVSYYSEVLGGTEDGGISRNEGYVFVAQSTVEICDITNHGEKIILKKGDSLIVNVTSYTPYPRYPVDSTRIPGEAKLPEPKKEDRFSVNKAGSVYYVNVHYAYDWPGTITYSHRKKKFTAKIKEGFDYGHTDAAP